MKSRNWFWGIFFILATIVLIASQFSSFASMGFWPLLATILLVALIIYCIMNRAAWGIFVPIALLYAIFQGPLGLYFISPWILILAGILLSIGFGLLFHKKTPHQHSHCNGGHRPNSKITENVDDENHPSIAVSFGNVTRYLQADALESANLECSFGALEVYFSQAKLSPNGAEIFLSCSFGSIHLYIPRNWNVIDRTQASMGKLTIIGNAQLDADSPRIAINGDISMSGVEVHYI